MRIHKHNRQSVQRRLALALLLTGPGLSLPNWLAIAKVFGAKKSVVYLVIIIFLGTTVGWFFGNFIL